MVEAGDREARQRPPRSRGPLTGYAAGVRLTVTPIPNVSDSDARVAWFARPGRRRGVAAGDHGPLADGDAGATWRAWCLATAAEVDAVHARAVAAGVAVVWPPTDEPWGMRECRLMHPDGHGFRVGAPVAP